MPACVYKVAKTKNPALVAALSVLLRWPARQLAAEYVVGQKLVGHLPTAHPFREIVPAEMSEAALTNELARTFRLSSGADAWRQVGAGENAPNSYRTSRPPTPAA